MNVTPVRGIKLILKCFKRAINSDQLLFCRTGRTETVVKRLLDGLATICLVFWALKRLLSGACPLANICQRGLTLHSDETTYLTHLEISSLVDPYKHH